MATQLSQDQAAEIVGLTARRLQQLDRAGDGPKRNASGGYPPDALGRWMRERLLGEMGVADDGKAYDYAAERARLTKAQADKTELEVAELRSDLISTPSALAQVEAIVAGMRTKLLALPVKVAAQAGVIPADMVKVQELVRVQVYDVLEEIASDGFRDELRRAIAKRTEAGVPGSQDDHRGYPNRVYRQFSWSLGSSGRCPKPLNPAHFRLRKVLYESDPFPR